MKKIKQRYPRRKGLLGAPFLPLTDANFRVLVSSGQAIPCQQGGSLFVSKWRDEESGIEVEAFLTALKSQGSSLEARTYEGDVNVRVVRVAPANAHVAWRARGTRENPH